MESKKPKFNSDFYEEANDVLAGFRKQYGGARFLKKGGDPFAKDPDVVQSQRQEKLVKEIRNVDTLGLTGW
jgi:hypothetical protein